MSSYKTEGKVLLIRLNELAQTDVFVETYLKLAEAEVRAELQGYGAATDKDYINDRLIDKHLMKLAIDLISLQTQRVANLENELDKLTKNAQV